jgi:hypothetical protein
MRLLKLNVLVALLCLLCSNYANAQVKNVLTIRGTGFELNGKPFEFTGISFFNALYNPEFNKSSEVRRKWIQQFNNSGINVLRVWCQWDNARGFVDAGKDQTMYNPDGTIKPGPLTNLISLLEDADTENTVILLVFFSQESWRENIRLNDVASDKAVGELTKVLKPYRNLVFQVWNEFDNRTLDYFKIIKNIDPERIVTNSPGYAGDLGNLEENRLLDYLSPHTTRDDNRHWEVAGKEIEYLLKKYNKPVVDDEPARKGTPKFGGPKSPTLATDHILHIYNVWKVGGFVVYHHDMFQVGTERESVPLNGIPAPGFSEYHDQVFRFLKEKERYLKEIRK